MKNFIQKNKGFVMKRILILIALILLLGGIYTVSKNGTNNQTGTPSITLTSPNGGETLTIGATTTVSFEMIGKIEEGYHAVIWLEEGAVPLATFPVPVPTTIPSVTINHSLVIPDSVLIGGDDVVPLEPGSYKIRIALYDGVPCTGFCLPSDVKELASDSSDGTLTVKKVFTQPFVPNQQSSTPYVNDGTNTPELISIEPARVGTVVGQTFVIKGKYLNGYEGSTAVFFTNVSKESPNYGKTGVREVNSYTPKGSTALNFTMPNRICIRVMGDSGMACPAYMDMTPGTYEVYVKPWSASSNKILFTISAASTSSQPSITVLSPNGGEVWKVGTKQKISWKTSGSSTDKIDIYIYEHKPECYSGSTYICSIGPATPIAPPTIATNISNTGEYTWTVGDQLMYGGVVKEGPYKISITGWSDKENVSAVSDISDNYFTITN